MQNVIIEFSMFFNLQSVSLSVRQKSLLKMSNEFVDYLNRIDNTETLLSKLASSADVFWRNKPGSQNCYLQVNLHFKLY